MATPGTTLFDLNNFKLFEQATDQTVPYDDAGPLLLEGAKISDILDSTDYENYLRDRYATELVQGTLLQTLKGLPSLGRDELSAPTAADVSEAQRYLGQQTLDPEVFSPSQRLEATRRYLSTYERPRDEKPLEPLKPLDMRPVNIPAIGVGMPQMLSVRKLDGSGEDEYAPFSPMFGKTEAETDYGLAKEATFISESERDYYRANNVNPDRYFNAGENAFNEWIVGLRDAQKETTLPLQGIIAVSNQLALDSESPWKLKAAYGLPINPTPREMEFVMKNEFPDIVGRIRYIDWRDKDKGLAVRVPKQDGSGEEEYIPLNPQFGLTMLGEEGLRMVAQETGTLTAEMLMEGGLGKKAAKMLMNGVQTSAEKFSSEVMKDTSFSGRVKRAGRTAATTSIAAAFGRYTQLMIAREQGINNISEERAFEDAEFAALLAGTSSLAISTVLGTLSKITRVFTGEDIPSAKLADIQKKINAVKAPKETPVEFTTDELIAIAKDVGAEVGKDFDLTNLTVGQLTGDASLQVLEQELFAELADMGLDAAPLFKEVIMGNREVAYQLWRELTRYSPGFENLKLSDFQKYLKGKQDEQIKAAKLAAEKEAEEIRKASQLDQQLDSASPLRQTDKQLADAFLRVKGSGNLVFRRDTPEFALQADETYNTLKNNLETAISGLGNLKYDRIPQGQSTSLITEEFRRVLNAGDSDALIKMMQDTELAALLKDLIPMKNGVSTLAQLAGEVRDKKGRFLPNLDLSYGDLVSMRNAVEGILLSHPDNKVKAATKPLLDAIDNQAMDLLRVEAKRQLKAQGIDSPSALRVDDYIENSEMMAPVLAARDAFDNYKRDFDRQYLKQFSEQSSPERLTEFVLNSSPEQINSLLQNIYANPDAIVRLQNIRQLILNDIEKAVDPLADPVSQNKAWNEYFESHKEQLQALFPESQFARLNDYASVQEAGIKQISQLDEGIEALEKELDLEMSFSDFVSDVLLASKKDKLLGNDDIALQKLRTVLDKYPELQSVVFDMTKANLRRQIENMKMSSAGLPSDAENMFNEVGAFDFAGFERFLSEAEESGPVGAAQFASRISQLLGPEIGNKFARNLRATGFIFNKLQNASPDKVLDDARKGMRNTLEQHMAIYSGLQRVLISPLSKTSRQLTFIKEKLTKRAANDLLNIMTDPSKLDDLIKSRNKVMTYKEFLNFISSLAVARANVDIGSEVGETPEQRQEKTLDIERDEKGFFTKRVDTFSRLTDLIEESFQ